MVLQLLTGRGVAVAAQGAAASSTHDKVHHIIVFGDSLVAGYGLAAQEAFPEVLGRELAARGHRVRVTNAGVSGDTTAGGLARMEWTLADAPDLLILELGANDGLRGLDVATMRSNLAAMLDACRRKGVKVLLAGMRAPRNMGPEYVRAFDAVYPDLARAYGVPLYPFFLDGVAMVGALNLPDGLHPNAEGVRVIVGRMLPHVEKMLPPM